MAAPRITLWTEPLNMPLRMSIRPFDEAKIVTEQAKDIQFRRPARVIKVTAGSLYILSAVVGRRMTESVRWVLFDSLQEILIGDLRTIYPEKQDLLAATFGELLGVILLALHLGGTIEVIRLLESQHGMMPDYLLVQTASSSPTVHILECKGSVEDVRNINGRPGKIDICQEQRDRFTKEAREQLTKIQLNNITTHGLRNEVVADSERVENMPP
jgi:hypothetical protein